MNERPTVTVPAEIEEAQRQFENWRGERKRGERIPKNLWGSAVELAKQHGVWPTARALHLDHNRLKRRVGNGDDEVKNDAFVELIPQEALRCTCIVEMEDGRGARMRIELKGAAADVTALSRTFWSGRE
ncbi:MAG TPA: hypothetical protein VK210_14515 [Terriglobia bacterium]|nr:hypothetical protein [Terriglobia bacterium]